ncbi:MAG: OmpA family protein [Thiobacillus sp.]|nr:OmpA family protein [Thiobacillus sp.]
MLGASVLAFTAMYAQASTGEFYDPSNAASKTGKTTGYELFGTIGCPGQGLLGSPCPKSKPVDKDSDGDGVVDSKDKCPDTPSGRKVNSDGCELESDGDGVIDGQDRCPNTPAGRKVDSLGCEADSDKDGVPDAMDKCPNTPAGQKVGSDGCEIDGDGDGVVDSQDKCPTVFAKTADGCPAPVVAAPAKLVLEGVNFDNDQATLRADATAILDQAADSLKQWGDIKVEVAGHTDDRGSDDYNRALSQRRADAVRTYLIGKGIAADRLMAKGYGESTPVADNETDAGRHKNRRVELSPVK